MLHSHPWAAWGSLIVVGAVLERQALKVHDGNSTLSCVTRWAFRTHTTEGRIVFLLGWGGLTAWFVPHILRSPSNDSGI